MQENLIIVKHIQDNKYEILMNSPMENINIVTPRSNPRLL